MSHVSAKKSKDLKSMASWTSDELAEWARQFALPEFADVLYRYVATNTLMKSTGREVLKIRDMQGFDTAFFFSNTYDPSKFQTMCDQIIEAQRLAGIPLQQRFRPNFEDVKKEDKKDESPPSSARSGASTSSAASMAVASSTESTDTESESSEDEGDPKEIEEKNKARLQQLSADMEKINAEIKRLKELKEMAEDPISCDDIKVPTVVRGDPNIYDGKTLSSNKPVKQDGREVLLSPLARVSYVSGAESKAGVVSVGGAIEVALKKVSQELEVLEAQLKNKQKEYEEIESRSRVRGLGFP